MKGHIFNLLEEFVEEMFGLDQFQQILDKCSFDTSAGFISAISYPDAMIIELVKVASQQLSVTEEEAQLAFGKWIFPRLLKLVPESYALFSHPAPFLSTVAEIHRVQLLKIYHDIIPPVFTYTDTDNFHSELTYQSERKMFTLVEGVIQGVADYYGVTISAEMVVGTDDETKATYYLTYGQAHDPEPGIEGDS